MLENKKYIYHYLFLVLLSLAFIFLETQPVQAQTYGKHDIKWLSVGSLRHWFSSTGVEVEYGRRGRVGDFLATDQNDGLRWPAEFQLRDHSVGKGLWIGTTEYTNPVTGNFSAYEVVPLGRDIVYSGNHVFPQEFYLIAREPRTRVYVDNAGASDLDVFDEIDEIDPNIDCDRLLYNVAHTDIGITIKRKIKAYSHPDHDNYYIYEYVFTNTGIRDDAGTTYSQTLTDVVFFFQYRYGFAYDLFQLGKGCTGVSWGLNTLNDVVGQDPNAPGFEFRAIFAWYGSHSESDAGYLGDIGAPDTKEGQLLGGADYAGTVVIHADRSVSDKSDDVYQPSTTNFMGSDRDAQKCTRDKTIMANKYGYMTFGHPLKNHAEDVGTSFADKYGGDPGGYSYSQGFGPYTMAPGDSIRIVLAEGIDGLSREKNKEVIYNWFNQNSPYTMPGGSSTTDDRNEYKNAYVNSCKDSLFQTFRRAIDMHENGYVVKPPPAPEEFAITSGGNKISITWTGVNAEKWSNFNGYRLYRAIDRPDTTYELIFSCDKNNVVNSYDDKTPRRGFNYYYYIQTVDDGSTNDINPGVPLTSSKYLTMTNQPARLTRPPGKSLSEIRVVPNPYNIRAMNLQFGSGADVKDQIAFYNIPAYCKIRIFTERGDLIRTLEHTDESGDEHWNMLTDSRQVVVSGLYIAYFEVTQDYPDPETGILLYKKGENTIKKFVIIR
ncbi:MAG: hypothetical protein JXB44_00560 [Calditrichaceae bacterium]|nr:hypothetical protein [Calditrichaceae bacterium]RQV97540.1 MAG: hypothetical protein EH224_00530 [Calditrichota bacterium]